ncbi:acyl-CoA thioesterase [Alicyclobacillus cycloheptanicus]|nr:acyl-CoA thioesterase [Alicyclobacillus cycloheptanicus]
MFTYELTVAFSDCDGLGHVNHAKYFTYMEEARRDVFRLFNPTLALDRWNLIAASARCDFLAQVKYAETLTVHTWVSRLGNSSFVVDHAIWNAAHQCVARGQTTLIAFDYATQKSTPLRPEVREALSRHTTPPEGVPALNA